MEVLKGCSDYRAALSFWEGLVGTKRKVLAGTRQGQTANFVFSKFIL
jgi:hypothetical protein